MELWLILFNHFINGGPSLKFLQLQRIVLMEISTGKYIKLHSINMVIYIEACIESQLFISACILCALKC